MKKILLVDDKATIGRVLKIYLGTEYDLEYIESPLRLLSGLMKAMSPTLSSPTFTCPHQVVQAGAPDAASGVQFPALPEIQGRIPPSDVGAD